jgi:Transposase DDE domain group 1
VVDVDSFVGEAYGYEKEGVGFGYTKRRGYHPMLASRAGTGEVLHVRLRRVRAPPARRRGAHDPRPQKDQALAHFPSGKFNANSAWTVIACIAHNLLRWTSVIGLSGETVRAARTMRRRLLHIPGRLTHSARQWTLHLPARWPCPGKATLPVRSHAYEHCPKRPDAQPASTDHHADPSPTPAI